MTIRILDRKRIMGLEPTKWDDYLKEAFDIDDSDLALARSPQSIEERVMRAANLLIAVSERMGVSHRELASQVTAENLGIVIGLHDPRNVSRHVTGALKQRYSPLIEKVELELNQRLPTTHFLRQELGIYEGDVYEAVKQWPKVRFSRFDLERNIRIPVHIGEVEAMLLGVFYGDGNLILEDEKSGRSRVTLYGTEEDFRFYSERVIPFLKQVFNLEERLKPRDPIYNVPGIERKSEAIFTWLHYHMNFPIARHGLRIPPFKDMIGWNVLKGVIATEAMVYMNEEKPVMRVTSHDREYLASIAALAKRFGLEYNENEAGDLFLLEFPKKQIREMVRRGIFINPYHEEVTLPLVKEVIEDPSQFRGLSRAKFLLLSYLYEHGVRMTELVDYFGLVEATIGYHADKALQMGLISGRRASALPKSSVRSIGEVIAEYMPKDESVLRLIAFAHNSNVPSVEIANFLGLKSIRQELDDARKLGLTVLDAQKTPRYMQRSMPQVADVYRRAA